MERNRGRWWTLAVTFVALNVLGLFWIRREVRAGELEGVRVLAVLPTENLEKTDRVTVVFDRPLTTGDRTDIPLVDPPFRIEPSPGGHWEWAEVDRLSFVLAEPLRPGREYTIAPTKSFAQLTGRRILGTGLVRLGTRRLALQECRVDSADDVAATLTLEFNQEVRPADLARHLHIGEGEEGADLDFEILTREPATELVVRLARPISNKAQIVIQKGLVGDGGTLGLEQFALRTVSMPLGFALIGPRVHPDRTSEIVTVHLRFTERLALDQELPRVLVDPPVEGLQVRPRRNDLLLEGPFECGARYTVTVGETLLSRDGETLGFEETVTVEVPDRPAWIDIPERIGVLSPDGNATLDILAASVSGIEVDAWRVHASNLVAHVRGESPRAVGRKVSTRTFPLELRPNSIERLGLDLRSVIDRPRGVYRVSIKATDSMWLDDSGVVSLSDLALTAKGNEDGYLVWVSSLITASPVPNTRVDIRSYNDQLLASAVTDEDGLARLPVSPGHPDGAPYVILAESEGDLNFLEVERHTWVFDEVDTSGRATADIADVMLYTERGVYRPGDTIHLTGIARSDAGDVLDGMALSIQVTRPDGREADVLSVRVPEDAQGMFQLDYPTPEDARTGPWKLAARQEGSSDVLGRATAFVETFLPVRIDLDASPLATRFLPGEEPLVAVRARSLLGGPAGHLPVTALARWRRASFTSEARPGFAFAQEDGPGEVVTQRLEARLDENGEAQLALTPPDDGPAGLWRCAVAVTVTEPGSRSVSCNLVVFADTSSRHLGLQAPGGSLVPVGEPFPLDWTLRDGADEPASPGPVRVELERVLREVAIEIVDGRRVWKTVEHTRPVEDGVLDLPDVGETEGTITLQCPVPGEYRVVATEETTRRRTRLVLHASRDASETWDLSEASPDTVELVLSDSTYVPGATAELLVKSPFAGRLLLTLESNRVHWQRVVEMTEPVQALEVLVPPDLRGGAFVSATVVRAVDPTNASWKPHRARGLLRLDTSHEDQRAELEIEAPGRAAPGEAVEVRVTTGEPRDPERPARVHLWAVDEGILLVGGDRTPDPFGHFLGRRRHEVRSQDTYSDLLPDHRRPASMTRIGGDESPEARRRNPAPARRREAPVVWCAPAVVDAEGVARFEVTLPDLRGELRWMAVVVDGDRYGSAARATTVATPVTAEASWPRFVAPGDEFDVPIVLTNLTDETASVTLSFEIDGPLALLGDGETETVDLGPGEKIRLWRRAASTGVGPVTAATRVRGTTSGGGVLDALARFELTSRPIAPLHTEVELVRVEAGERLVLERPEGFHRKGLRTRVEIGGDPAVELRPVLRDLVDYPYGCVEQTTSRIYALLYAPGILEAESLTERRRPVVDDMIEAGIDRLWSMQTPSGGLSYWSGSNRPDLFGSVYAAGCLIEARERGIPVRARLIDDLLAYLAGELRGDGASADDPNLRAFVCRALATFDRPDRGWMTRLTERIEELDMAGRAHLAVAWLESGRRDLALECLADEALLGLGSTSHSGRITSRTRQEAVLLKALLDVDPEHPWIAQLVRRLEKARTKGAWGNTLSNATVLTALARYQELHRTPSEFVGTLYAGARQEAFASGDEPAVFRFAELDGPVEIETTGEGWVSVLFWSEGLLADEFPPVYDRNLIVRRTWLDTEGEVIDLQDLSVGDLVLAKVTLSAPGMTDGGRLENLAVVDALPGGFEVENPRLEASADLGGHLAGRPDRSEFLDDRVVLFTSAGKKARSFVYPLRVVASGTFAVPPVQASSMYDPGFASLSGEAVHVTVRR